jgi:hypothetical protein
MKTSAICAAANFEINDWASGVSRFARSTGQAFQTNQDDKCAIS